MASGLEVAFDDPPPQEPENKSLEPAQRVKIALKGAWAPDNGYFDYGWLKGIDSDFITIGDDEEVNTRVRLYPRENIARIDYEMNI